METHNPYISLEKRLLKTKYSHEACTAAIRGEAIPFALGHPLHRLCVIRGIRYHHGFGVELHGILPVFTRALNARSIMSNVIPELGHPETVPCCIWHPETASEDTYKKLAQRYPHLSYQIGRACAVAGYSKLFRELDILPEVHIAEEARECGNLEIYDAIVSQTIRYKVMNDYNRHLNLSSPERANLNGDSCVRWMLDIKQEFEDPTRKFMAKDGKIISTPAKYDHFKTQGYRKVMFNITEDKHIDEYESDSNARRLHASRSNLRWLYEPLPRDLPTVQKDILIAMAAYYGDVDRYSRLRRPKPVDNELNCCVRGIYHNTLFALWWANQSTQKDRGIEMAINARFIMNNVLSRAPFPDFDEPYLIWWPSIAAETTYRRLASVQPSMVPQIICACIYANYPGLFAELLPQVQPDQSMFGEAHFQTNQYFQQALDERLAHLGIEDSVPSARWDSPGRIREKTGEQVVNFLDVNSIGTHFEAPYNGRQCDTSAIELMLCLPDAWKLPVQDSEGTIWGKDLDYVTWPPDLADKDQ